MAVAPHPIAQYLPLEARAEAAKQKYGRRIGHLRCDYSERRPLCCPLGVALVFMGNHDVDVAAPTATIIARTLWRRLTDSGSRADYGEIYAAATSFIKAWDADLIDPATLAVELGVDRPQEP